MKVCQINLQDKIDAWMEDKQGVRPKQDAADVNGDSAARHISHNNKLHIHFALYLNGELRNH